jgi:hypothetical protein
LNPENSENIFKPVFAYQDFREDFPVIADFEFFDLDSTYYGIKLTRKIEECANPFKITDIYKYSEKSGKWKRKQRWVKDI